MTLLIAYPKGRLGDELLEKIAGNALGPAVDPGRALKVPAREPGVELVFLKGSISWSTWRATSRRWAWWAPMRSTRKKTSTCWSWRTWG